MSYVLDFDEKEYLIESSENLARHLEAARQRDYAGLWLAQRHAVTSTEFEKIVYPLFGLDVPKKGKSLGVLLNNILAKAFVVFVVDDDTNFHSCNPNYLGESGAKVCFYLSNDQRDEYLASECVTVDEAFSEMFYFFKNHEKSEQICWMED